MRTKTSNQSRYGRMILTEGARILGQCSFPRFVHLTLIDHLPSLPDAYVSIALFSSLIPLLQTILYHFPLDGQG